MIYTGEDIKLILLKSVYSFLGQKGGLSGEELRGAKIAFDILEKIFEGRDAPQVMTGPFRRLRLLIRGLEGLVNDSPSPVAEGYRSFLNELEKELQELKGSQEALSWLGSPEIEHILAVLQGGVERLQNEGIYVAGLQEGINRLWKLCRGSRTSESRTSESRTRMSMFSPKNLCDLLEAAGLDLELRRVVGCFLGLDPEKGEEERRKEGETGRRLVDRGVEVVDGEYYEVLGRVLDGGKEGGVVIVCREKGGTCGVKKREVSPRSSSLRKEARP